MGDKTEKEKHKKISSLMRDGWLRSTISRKPQRHSITPYPDILSPLNTQHLSGTIDVKGVGDQEKPGGYAAFASHVSSIPGYQRDGVERQSSFKTWVRTCSKR
jgi:hypothetical protein